MKITGKSRLQLVFVFIIIFIFFSSVGATETPRIVVKNTIDSVIAVLKDKSLSTPEKREERRKRISTIIRSRFDFWEMARRVLAQQWRKRTEEEKKEFVEIFSDLLETSYIGKIEGYTNEIVTVDKEIIKRKGKYAVVKTTIKTKDVDIPIDYKLIFKKGQWRVYDVIVEGVSFVSTYRSQYNTIIRKEKFSGLIKRMKEKLEQMKKT